MHETTYYRPGNTRFKLAIRYVTCDVVDLYLSIHIKTKSRWMSLQDICSVECFDNAHLILNRKCKYLVLNHAYQNNITLIFINFNHTEILKEVIIYKHRALSQSGTLFIKLYSSMYPDQKAMNASVGECHVTVPINPGHLSHRALLENSPSPPTWTRQAPGSTRSSQLCSWH